MKELRTRQGRKVFVTTVGDKEEIPNLSTVHERMQQYTSVLLSTQLEDLEKSYKEGYAAILLNEEGEAVGYARMSSLLGEREIEQLGLPSDFPKIAEFGSAYIHPDYRGIYGEFKNEVLRLVLDQIHQKKLLVLGTTKSMAVIIATEKAKEIGIEFASLVHTDLDMIAPFTCTCTPNFGSGFQFGSFCKSRIVHEEIEQLGEISRQREGRIPCIMTVSDSNLAKKMNDTLHAHFGKQRSLVGALVTIGHYN